MLLNEKNELHNRNLHISGLLNEEKVDIEDTKVDIENEKVDIQDEKVDIEQALQNILEYCDETTLKVPFERGEILFVVDSLAQLKYRISGNASRFLIGEYCAAPVSLPNLHRKSAMI